MECPFCHLNGERVLAESEHNVAIETGDPVLVGSAMVIPRAHRATPFELTPEEWVDTLVLVQRAKETLDQRYRPDGYNLGWNCGAVAGQEVFHAHLHVIPRYKGEPLAGRGIRYSLKQPANSRSEMERANWVGERGSIARPKHAQMPVEIESANSAGERGSET